MQKKSETKPVLKMVPTPAKFSLFGDQKIFFAGGCLGGCTLMFARSKIDQKCTAR